VLNAANVATAQDTVTITVTGPGLVNDGTTSGKSIVKFQTGTSTYSIFPDGTAGNTTITVALTKTGQTFTKAMTFYAKNATTITPTVRTPLLKVGDNDEAVGVAAVDVNGNAWTGSVYMVASSAADALIAGSETPVACNAYDVVKGIRCNVKAIGVGMNQCETPTRVIKETDIDMVLIAGRYSLLDQKALEGLLPAALERNVDIIAAGVFNSGILANPVKGATYDYVPASDELLAKAVRIREVLEGHKVSLTSAALQFPLRHPAVKSVLVGCRSAAEVATNIAEFDKTIENKVWDDLVSVL
jgi:hypothetical protein